MIFQHTFSPLTICQTDFHFDNVEAACKVYSFFKQTCKRCETKIGSSREVRQQGRDDETRRRSVLPEWVRRRAVIYGDVTAVDRTRRRWESGADRTVLEIEQMEIE